MARRTKPGAPTVQTQVPKTDLKQAVTPTGTTGVTRPGVSTVPAPGQAVPSETGGEPVPVSVEQAAGEAQAQSAIDAASQQANPLVRQSNLLDVGANAATFYPTALQPTNVPAAANFSNFNAGTVTPPSNFSSLAGGVSYPQGVLGTPASALPATIPQPQPQAGPVDRYNKWLIGQGINPTTIGNAKLVTGPQGQRTMDLPSIAQETQAAQTLGQVHAKHADLMRAAMMTNRSNPTLSAQLKDAARGIFPQTSSYENNLRGYLDLIRPDALKSTAGLEQYLPTGYRPVMTPDQIAQQYGDLIKTAKKPLKQKRAGQVENDEET